MKRLFKATPAFLPAALLLSFVSVGCGNKNMASKGPASNNAQPDKILYDRALNDYQHGRYTESRLSLQTLINSYPDSEYLAKAKLAVADSYFKEGGVEGLTQAVAEYKDFITFFPFLPEATYAQMQVGMAHYRMMEKADRDKTQAQLAEQEFQTFLLKYPKDPLTPQAAQKLRDVQEVLAQADFDVAHFYYIKGDYRASVGRLTEVTGRYPLFSQSDRALWMLGDIYRRVSRGSKNEQERVRWRTQSDEEYAKLLKYYPLSPLTGDAKRQLTEDGVAIPPPDPQALARAQEDVKLAAHDRPGIIHRAMGVIKSAPDVSSAARAGEPDLNPPGEINASQDILQGGTSSTVTATSATGSGSGQSAGVETVRPGESSNNPPAGAASAVTDPPASTASTAMSAEGIASTGGTGEPLKPNETATDAAAAAEMKGNSAAKEKPSKASSSASKKSKPAKAPKTDKSKESTSKKKKGIHKLIPW